MEPASGTAVSLSARPLPGERSAHGWPASLCPRTGGGCTVAAPPPPQGCSLSEDRRWLRLPVPAAAASSPGAEACLQPALILLCDLPVLPAALQQCAEDRQICPSLAGFQFTKWDSEAHNVISPGNLDGPVPLASPRLCPPPLSMSLVWCL